MELRERLRLRLDSAPSIFAPDEIVIRDARVMELFYIYALRRQMIENGISRVWASHVFCNQTSTKRLSSPIRSDVCQWRECLVRVYVSMRDASAFKCKEFFVKQLELIWSVQRDIHNGKAIMEYLCKHLSRCSFKVFQYNVIHLVSRTNLIKPVHLIDETTRK